MGRLLYLVTAKSTNLQVINIKHRVKIKDADMYERMNS
jgi:hypothetical protein